MKKHLPSVFLGGIATVVLVLPCMSALPATGQQAPAKQKWEYEISRLSQQDAKTQLNKLGETGWELVSIEPTFEHGPTTFYLKRSN